jgi:uncharacterized protein YoxC
MVRPLLAAILVMAVTGGHVSAAPKPKVAAIHVEVSFLEPIESAVIEIQEYADKLDVETLGVTYKDGRAIEQWRNLLAKQTRIALDVIGKLRRVDSIALAVILSQGVSAIRDSMNSLSDRLQTAGENSTSAAAVRAAIPLATFDNSLVQPSNDLDERVQTIAGVGDDAVRECGRD